MKRAYLLPLIVFAALVASPHAGAQGKTTSSAVELAQRADTLKPGEWVWAPSISPRGPVTIYADLNRQIATIYRNGVRIGVSTLSSGKPGYETPTGVFAILQKSAKHRSNKYNDAPMPYQQRLTWDGVALHAGGLPGYPESHGCVHLPLSFSKLLFGITDMGGTVVVAGRAGANVVIPASGVLAPVSVGGAKTEIKPLENNEQYRWQPELSPSGPVSLIVSTSDQRMIVLRNGIEIGRSRIAVPTGDGSTHVMTLIQSSDGRPQWIYADVPGYAGESGAAVDASTLAKLEMPDGFRENVRTLLVPGVTVLITRAGVGAKSTGPRLTIISGSPEKEAVNRPN